jgi:hypothetical protein
MNNEPVAWIAVGDNTSVFFDLDCALAIDDNPTPLYTHPVKEQDCYGDGNVYRGVRSKDSEVQTIYFNPVKELTDEEIMEVATINLGHSMGLLNWMGFARAILRKVQEK